MAAPRHPRLPDEVAEDLRSRLAVLPRGVVRFRTDEGACWLRDLKLAAHQYGGVQLSRALGLSTTTVYTMINRRLPNRTYLYPNDEQMQGIRDAWKDVQYLNKRKRQVRKTTPEYERMYRALRDLLKLTDLTMIGAALGVEPTRLRDFIDPPQLSSFDRALLAALHVLVDRLPGSPSQDPEFLAHLREAAQEISLEKLAEALHRPAEEIRAWLGNGDAEIRRRRVG